jgi:hypothetical protein
MRESRCPMRESSVPKTRISVPDNYLTGNNCKSWMVRVIYSCKIFQFWVQTPNYKYIDMCRWSFFEVHWKIEKFKKKKLHHKPLGPFTKYVTLYSGILDPPPFVTQNRTNPYIFTEVRNKSLTPPGRTYFVNAPFDHQRNSILSKSTKNNKFKSRFQGNFPRPPIKLPSNYNSNANFLIS